MTPPYIPKTVNYNLMFQNTKNNAGGFPPALFYSVKYRLISTSPWMPGTRPVQVYCHISIR